MNARDRTTVVTSTNKMSIIDAIILVNTWSTVLIWMILIEPLVGVEVFERYPIFLPLQPWVISYSSLDAVLMVTLEPKKGGLLALVLRKLVTYPFLGVVIAVDILFVVLSDDGFWLPCVVAIEGLHVGPITQVNYIIRLQVVEEARQPSEPLVTDVW